VQHKWHVACRKQRVGNRTGAAPLLATCWNERERERDEGDDHSVGDRLILQLRVLTLAAQHKLDFINLPEAKTRVLQRYQVCANQ